MDKTLIAFLFFDIYIHLFSVQLPVFYIFSLKFSPTINHYWYMLLFIMCHISSHVYVCVCQSYYPLLCDSNLFIHLFSPFYPPFKYYIKYMYSIFAFFPPAPSLKLYDVYTEWNIHTQDSRMRVIIPDDTSVILHTFIQNLSCHFLPSLKTLRLPQGQFWRL